jgi:hypothetical protein
LNNLRKFLFHTKAPCTPETYKKLEDEKYFSLENFEVIKTYQEIIYHEREETMVTKNKASVTEISESNNTVLENKDDKIPIVQAETILEKGGERTSPELEVCETELDEDEVGVEESFETIQIVESKDIRFYSVEEESQVASTVLIGLIDDLNRDEDFSDSHSIVTILKSPDFEESGEVDVIYSKEVMVDLEERDAQEVLSDCSMSLSSSSSYVADKSIAYKGPYEADEESDYGAFTNKKAVCMILCLIAMMAVVFIYLSTTGYRKF